MNLILGGPIPNATVVLFFKCSILLSSRKVRYALIRDP